MSTESPNQLTEAEFVGALFEHLPGLAWLLNESGRIVRWNRGYQKLVGLSDEALANLHAVDIVVPRDHERVAAMMRDVLAGHEVTYSCSLRVGEGEVPLHGTLALLQVSNQRFVFVAASDASVQLATEAALAQGERRYHAVFNSTHDALVIHGDDGRVLDVNERWCTMFGVGREEALATGANQLAFLERPYSRVDAHEKIRLATQVGPQVFEWPCRRANGEVFWAEVALRAATITEKPCVIAVVRDISERRAAESEITEWKQRYDVLVRAAGQIVYDCNVDGTIVWGDAMTTILGYGPDELQGGYAEWAERVHPDERDDIVRQLDAATAAGTAFLADYRFRHKSGEYRWIEDAGYPLFDAQGTLVRYVGIMADVTAQKQADAERRRLEESLRQAQKMESIGRLAGGIAHDFNNLLTAISGNLSLALMGEGSKASTEDVLFEAARAAESAANLTRQLLTFSRKQVIHPKVICLNATIKGLQKMLRRLLGEDVELGANLAPDLGRVESDQGQIEQVLVNLAVNSRDAMPHGGQLVIQTANVNVEETSSGSSGPLPPGEYVLLTVTDNGTGMSPEVQEHLFEPFFTTKEAGKGTGLGLAMVYGAVQQNRGHIVVDSERGRGTRISIYLPRVEATAECPSHTSSAELAVGAEAIMVVEDEEQVRSLAVRILQRQGFRVHAYGSGEDALAALSHEALQVDLLLTDVVMPGMNGRVLAERALQLRPDLRVLFTSGYTDDVIVQHGVLEHCPEFLPKPYSVEDLTRRVRMILDQATVASKL